MTAGRRLIEAHWHWRARPAGVWQEDAPRHLRRWPVQIEAVLVVRVPGVFWWRAGAVAGEAPGSRMGHWRTRTGPGRDDVRGHNWRAGSLLRCVTLWCHWRTDPPDRLCRATVADVAAARERASG